MLCLYWFDNYGGGAFLPFRDATNGRTTYGQGRYLLDTGKGADLGSRGGLVVLDFNYSYHPSCVYDAKCSWISAISSRRSVREICSTIRAKWDRSRKMACTEVVLVSSRRFGPRRSSRRLSSMRFFRSIGPPY